MQQTAIIRGSASKDEAGMAKHHREQPHDPRQARLIRERDDKAREVDLCLLARRRLEPHFKRLGPMLRADCGNEPLHRSIGTAVPALAKLAVQTYGAEVGEHRDALTQVIEVRPELARPARLTRTVGWQLQSTLDVFANRLGVAAGAPGDGANR